MRASFTAATLGCLAKPSFCHAIREHSNHTVETITSPTPVFPASHVLCPLLLPVQRLNSIASTVCVYEIKYTFSCDNTKNAVVANFGSSLRAKSALAAHSFLSARDFNYIVYCQETHESFCTVLDNSHLQE